MRLTADTFALQLFLRSTFSLPNVTMDDCMHLALEPSELRLWLHFLLDVTPSNTGENHFIWKTRPGFPYGYACITTSPILYPPSTQGCRQRFVSCKMERIHYGHRR